MDNPNKEIITITKEEERMRLDSILAGRYKEVNSRTYFQNLIQDHRVLLNGEIVKKSTCPKEGDTVEVNFVIPPEIAVVAENIPLTIIYEDHDILVINKPAGMVVHPAPGNWTNTFVNALLYHCQELEMESPTLRPGIVHRLDKDTSGVLVAAKNSLAQKHLIEMFSKRGVHKEYVAICIGNPGQGHWLEPIGRHPVHRKKMHVDPQSGRYAKTKFHTIASDAKLSLVHIVIETGRTHQIRVHLSHHHTPILGDHLYGNVSANKKFDAKRQMLHAWKLAFKHPISAQSMEFIADIPEDMNRFVKRLSPSFH